MHGLGKLPMQWLSQPDTSLRKDKQKETGRCGNVSLPGPVRDAAWAGALVPLTRRSLCSI